MASLGGLLMVFGIGSLVLPLLDLQFTLMGWLDPYQPVAGLVVAAIGAVLLFLASQRRGVSAPVAPPAASAAPAAADAPTSVAQEPPPPA